MTAPRISRRLHADLETPVSAFLKLAGGNTPAFLFESMEGRDTWARYSIIGVGARSTYEVRDHGLLVQTRNHTRTERVSDALTGLLDLITSAGHDDTSDMPDFVNGAFGYVAYNAARGFEPALNASSARQLPDAYFFVPELLAVFDNRHHHLTLFAENDAQLATAIKHLRMQPPPLTATNQWASAIPATSNDDFSMQVRRAQEYIRAGDLIQIVLSRAFTLPPLGDPFAVYRGLRTINPSPYMFFMRTPHVTLAGASPEVMVRVRAKTATLRPIAGTRPRAENAATDAALAAELLADPKERAEHVMLVDLGRNDLGRVCEAGSVHVPSFMNVENYSHVMHLVSQVEGTLRADVNAADVVRACFPAGTLTGAPKVRAMQIIDELEKAPRGVYGGAVGYFAPGGNADFGIAIRTLEAYPDRWVVQAGAGVVLDSVPAKEAEETEHKARAVLKAAQWAADLLARS